MAHRIAELIGAEAAAGSDAERAVAREQTQELILELWAMRAALPGRVDPISRLKSAIEVLEKLSENEKYYYQHASGGDASEQYALKAHHATSTIIRNLALVKLATEFAVYDADEENLPLSDEETYIRKLLDEAMSSAIARRIFIVNPDSQMAESRSNVDLLRDKIATAVDDALTSLNGVKKSVVNVLDLAEGSEGSKKRKRVSTVRSFGSRTKSI
jgi:hypothetical protein